MAFRQNKEATEKEIVEFSDVGEYGKKKYGRLVRLFREGYISIAIYKNAYEQGKIFYDIVVYRKIRMNGSTKYKRGANLKPQDLPHLQNLLRDAQDYVDSLSI